MTQRRSLTPLTHAPQLFCHQRITNHGTTRRRTTLRTTPHCRPILGPTLTQVPHLFGHHRITNHGTTRRRATLHTIPHRRPILSPTLTQVPCRP